MVESLILLLLSSGLYRQTHAAAMTACCALGIRGCGAGTECLFLRVHGEPPGARCPVRSTMRGHARLRSHGTTCRHPPSAIRHPPVASTTRAEGEAERHAAVAWWHPPAHRGEAVRLRLPVRCCCMEERRASSRAVFGFIAPAPAPARRGAARRKQARAANAGQDHRCRTRDGVDRRAPARRRAPGSGVLLKRAASGLSRAGPSAPLPPSAAGRGSPRRAA